MPPSAGDRASTLPEPSVVRHNGHSIVQIALKYRGVAYRWGGSTPAGFDCSGFVKYVYARAGVSLPRTAEDQYRAGAPVAKHELKAGDLVFFNRLRHNGIYIGQGRFVHASRAGGGVSVSSLEGHWFKDRWSGARRIRAMMSGPSPDGDPSGVAAHHGGIRQTR